jgi:tubulin---tyrosine ligase
MIPGLLSPEGLSVYWTTLWRNSYNRLFKSITTEGSRYSEAQEAVQSAEANSHMEKLPEGNSPIEEQLKISPLTFKFAPEFQSMINPDLSKLPEGCDAWALAKGAASVTALAASFAEVDINGILSSGTKDRPWKL